MIRIHKTTIEKAGGCCACDVRSVEAIKEITIGSEYHTMTIRLCVTCEKELKQALRDSK